MIAYSIMSVLALILAAIFWSRKSHSDARLLPIFAAALGGAIVGAKIGYIVAEGVWLWRFSGSYSELFGGKTIVGGLIGGYLGVELMKRVLRYPHITGDLFATVVPTSIAIGRIGCWQAGCCLGKLWPLKWYSLVDAQRLSRWPAAPVELLFNVNCIGVFLYLRRINKFSGQHFHLYMISYGLFRFAHEYFRENAVEAYGLSGYQVQSAILMLLGLSGFILRLRAQNRSVAANITGQQVAPLADRFTGLLRRSPSSSQ